LDNAPPPESQACTQQAFPTLLLLFLSRVTILTRDIDTANLSICPSVRYVPVSDENSDDKTLKTFINESKNSRKITDFTEFHGNMEMGIFHGKCHSCEIVN